MRTLFKSSPILVVTALLPLTTVSEAAPPKKLSVAKFNALISRSPFTIKPKPDEVIRESPLERDWMLGSIRPSGDGWSVTLIHKKDRKNRIRLIPGFSAGDFQLLEVKQDAREQENSRVRIRKGSQTAWITYDAKLIKVRPTTTAKTSNKKPSTSASSRRKGPPIPGQSGSKRTTPRVRHVPRSNR